MDLLAWVLTLAALLTRLEIHNIFHPGPHIIQLLADFHRRRP